MHVYMNRQLAADRISELRADAHRARLRRDRRASEAGQALARPEVRAVLVCAGTRLLGVVTRKTLVRAVVARQEPDGSLTALTVTVVGPEGTSAPED